MNDGALFSLCRLFVCRFMICCDKCEDWFHGKCVGITVAQGKKMEREGRDYVCPICLENETKTKEEKEINRYVCVCVSKMFTCISRSFLSVLCTFVVCNLA